jgi:lipopolysaccharide export system protein LptA
LLFIGHAMAKQGDVTINSDRLTIYYGSQGGDVDRIIAEGTVRIVQGNRVATGNRVEYFRLEDRMVLSGSPKVTEGANSVQGDEIVLYLKENRSVVMGGQSGRVNAVFQPKREGER